jgi:hypothetical protein
MISVERSKKGKLLDLIESNQAENHKGFTPTGDAPIPSYALSVGKDTKLLSILQIADVKRRKQGDALQTAAFQPHGGISPFLQKCVINTPSEGGVSSISHTVETVPAISLQSRGDMCQNHILPSAKVWQIILIHKKTDDNRTRGLLMNLLC